MYQFKEKTTLEEVMITLCLFIGYEPQSSPKNIILVQKVPLLETDHFDLLDFSKKSLLYLVSTYSPQKIYKCYIHTILGIFGLIQIYLVLECSSLNQLFCLM